MSGDLVTVSGECLSVSDADWVTVHPDEVAEHRRRLVGGRRGQATPPARAGLKAKRSKRRPDRSDVTLGGISVSLAQPGDVLEAVAARLDGGFDKPLFVGSANLDHIRHFGAASGRHDLFSRDNVDWQILLDGMPLVWMASYLTGRSLSQVAGSDLLPEVLRLAADRGTRVGVLGGTSDMHTGLEAVIKSEFDGLRLVGLWCPSRQDLEDPQRARELATAVRESGTDLLVVGLGKPRQECWLADYGLESNVKVGLAFGAASDFLAGAVPRAPLWIRKRGLEWLYRLVREPKRLGMRYLVRGPADLRRLLVQSR